MSTFFVSPTNYLIKKTFYPAPYIHPINVIVTLQQYAIAIQRGIISNPYGLNNAVFVCVCVCVSM